MAPPKRGRSPESKILANIVSRCTNPKNTNYHRYGGRGISVCERWRTGGYLAFLEDMGPRPSPDHEIDRYPDNDGNYEPGNCRWVLHAENMRNTSRNRMVEYQGESLCLTEFARRVGLTVSSVKTRLNSGWTVAEIISIPLGRQRPKKACPHGHAYVPENVYRNKKGNVVCRTCVLEKGKKRCRRRQTRSVADQQGGLA